MRIAIIGAGNVGQALGAGWAKKNHQVVFGVRDPNSDKTKAALKASSGATADTVANAIKRCEVVLLAIPFDATQALLAGAGNLTGKIILDATNPLQKDLSGLTIGHDTSAGEKIAEWAPTAKVVKIFNTTGANNMANPLYQNEPIPMLYAGDDATAKSIAAQLATDAGMAPVHAGPLRNSRLLEPYAMLWIYLAYRGGFGREFAFTLARR